MIIPQSSRRYTAGVIAIPKVMQQTQIFFSDPTCSRHTGPRGIIDSPARTPEPPLLAALPPLVSHAISGTRPPRRRCQAYSAASTAATSTAPTPNDAPMPIAAPALLCGAGAARKARWQSGR